MELTFTLFMCFASLATVLSSPLPYVINGHDVKDSTKWPWQGSLRIKTGSDINPHTCGCALISTTEAVTAAHCVHGDDPEAFDVKFGNSLGKTNDATIRSLTKIVTHEDYGAGGFGYPNDIAILTFDPPVTLNTTVNTITLSTADQAGNPDCWITGFGFTQMSYSGDSYQALPRWLQEGNVTVYTNTECKKTWTSGINPGHVCVGDIENRRGAGSCNGDSGGPLVCKVDGSWELVGVTSWGSAGCRISMPSVYTRISHFTQWIDDNRLQALYPV